MARPTPRVIQSVSEGSVGDAGGISRLSSPLRRPQPADHPPAAGGRARGLRRDRAEARRLGRHDPQPRRPDAGRGHPPHRRRGRPRGGRLRVRRHARHQDRAGGGARRSRGAPRTPPCRGLRHVGQRPLRPARRGRLRRGDRARGLPQRAHPRPDRHRPRRGHDPSSACSRTSSCSSATCPSGRRDSRGTP